MKIVFVDGNEFNGDNFEEIVQQLKKLDATQPETINKYMKIAQKRYDNAKVELNINNPKQFIKSLEEVGIVKIKG